MTAVQVVIVVGVTFLVIMAMVVVANRVIASERRIVQRRYEEWVARGRFAEDEPKFFSGNGDPSGGAGWMGS